MSSAKSPPPQTLPSPPPSPPQSPPSPPPPDGPTSHECELLTSLQTHLTHLNETFSCAICHDKISTPVSLPCLHIFCSGCIRRHLQSRSNCPHPTCLHPATPRNLTPYRHLDAQLTPLRTQIPTIIPPSSAPLPFLNHRTTSKSLLISRLRAHNLPIHGRVEALADRYNAFALLWNANLDAAVPLSKRAIVNAALNNHRSTTISRKPFFAYTTLAPTKGPAPGESDTEQQITEGDSFDALIRKTKLRAHRKRPRSSIPTSSSHLHTSPTSPVAQSTAPNTHKLLVVPLVCTMQIPPAVQPPVAHPLQTPQLSQHPSRQLSQPDAQPSITPRSPVMREGDSSYAGTSPFGRGLWRNSRPDSARPFHSAFPSSQLQTQTQTQTQTQSTQSVASPLTEAQLRRAESNRLAAIEKRKKFYARQSHKYMRQPHL